MANTVTMDVINGNVLTDKSNDANEDNVSVVMEKLQSKTNQMKSWTELTKMMKQSVNEKRHTIDVNERSQLQRCLDTIQKSIRITSLQSMVERLETICRQLGLKFSLPRHIPPNRYECFIHSEMYYVEVLLEAPTGHVVDCKVAHHAEALSCPELTEVLRKGDFVEFTKHLEGLSAIYQINADKKNKSKAYLALHALEIDLSSLAELQNHQINDINNLVHKSPVGILEPRKGGHPMRLTYFVPPYDLIDVASKSCLPLNVEVILEKKLGTSATVCIESSTSHRLQHESLINTLKTPEGKNLPQFSALSNLNSTQLPACFVLRLQKPLVASIDTLRKIRADTNIDFNHELFQKRESLIHLVAKQLLGTKNGTQSANSPFHVKLPDQNHCYHLNDSCDKLDGVVITTIPITHPTHVPRILVHLRQQVLFNVIIGSFIRQTSKAEDTTNIFEVTTTSMSNINIQFEHPAEESLANVDLDLRDVTNVKCKLYPSSLSSFCSDDYSSKIMQRCLSIPVTMRSIINKCKERAAALKEQMGREQLKQMLPNANDLYFSSLNGTNGSTDQNMSGRQQSLSYLSQQLQQYNGNQAQLQQQMNQQLMGQNATLQGQQQNLQRFLAQKMQQQLNNQEGMQHNRPQLTLQQLHQQQQQMLQQNQTHNQLLNQNAGQQKHNAMLMSMLSDLPAANSQMALNLLKQQQQQQQLQQQFQLQQQLQYIQQQQQQSQQKPKKQRKRKATNDNLIRSPGSSTGKSPKRKLSDDDFNRDLPDDGLVADPFQWGNETPNACRSSSTPSSTSSFAETIGNIKQELNMSLGGTTPTSGTDTVNAYSFLGQRPFGSNQSEFNEFSSNELPLYGESGAELMSDVKPSLALSMNQALMSAKSATKRAAKRLKSDASDDASGTGDEGHNEQLKIIKSLEDLHQKDNFSKFMANQKESDSNVRKNSMNSIKTMKSSVKTDVRRCSSAGIEGSADAKKSANLSNMDELGELSAAIKKERKRKRAESVDSLKAQACSPSTTVRAAISGSAIISESSMMPPPMIGSMGDVSSSSCMSFLEANTSQKMIPNIKMTPTSTSVSPTTSPTIMKITSCGKKSLIGANVSSTSGGESKVSKGLGNKMEKSSALSSLLKTQKQGFGVSMKTSDTERTAGVGPSQPPKGLTFKASKTKSSSKSGLNASPAKLKDKSQLLSGAGFKLKSGISSTSSLSSKAASMAVSSSSGVPSGANSSMIASSVTSSKQQTAKLAKISRKSSLTAVVDRLHQKQDGTTTGPTTSPEAGGRPESSSLATSRPDTTSSPKVSQSGGTKTAEPKNKYARTSDQFTIKQSNSGGGLKMSITKTKSGGDSSNKIGPGGTGLFKTTATSKFTIPKLPKANSSSSPSRPAATSSSPTTATTTSTSSVTSVSSNSPIRRPVNPNTKVTTGNIRPNVSSSTHPGGALAFGAIHPKPFADRMGPKLTGANIPTNKNPLFSKSLADKFKATVEPSSTTKPSNTPESMITNTSTSFQGTGKTGVESSRPPVYSKFDGVSTPMPVSYSRSVSASVGNISPQLPASTTPPIQLNKPTFTKSLSVDNDSTDRLLTNWAQTSESATVESRSDVLSKSQIISSSDNSSINSQTGAEKLGVSSSSDVKASTSTPSSPAEMSLIADAFQNPPPLIPTEAIDESSEGVRSGGSATVDPDMECDNSSQIAIDSSQSANNCLPSIPTEMSSTSLPTNEVSTSDNSNTQQTQSQDSVEPVVAAPITQSRVEMPDISDMNKAVVDDDEDGDGLVIDDREPTSEEPTPTDAPTVANSEMVSSSTCRVSGSNGSESPPKPSTSPISNSNTPPVVANPALALTSTNSTLFGSVNSPSNQSTTSSLQRPSPYPMADIDDELMDEALVGSNE